MSKRLEIRAIRFATIALFCTIIVTITGCFGGWQDAGGLDTTNRKPAIRSIAVSSTTPNPGNQVTFTCDATDSDVDPLTYFWTASVQSGGSASPTPTSTPSSNAETRQETPSPTPTPSATPTAVATPTPTPSATPDATPTPAPTTTPSPTPTPGSSNSNTFVWTVPSSAIAGTTYAITCSVSDDRNGVTSKTVTVTVAAAK